MKFIQLSLIFILIISISGCDVIDDSPCGPHAEFDLYLLGSSTVDQPDVKDYLNTYMEGNNRVFQWSELVDHVCSDDHVRVDYRVALLNEETATQEKITARGTVNWLFLFGETIPLTQSGSDLKGNMEVGLKQAFPDLNGWFVPAVEVVFATKGSYDADTSYIKKQIISIELKAKYREYNQ